MVIRKIKIISFGLVSTGLFLGLMISGQMTLAAEGDLIWARTNNPSNDWEYPFRVIADASYIYVVGNDEPMGVDDGRWRIEKWDKDGNNVWIRNSNPSIDNGDMAYGATLDATYIYVSGYSYSIPGWRIEKWDKSGNQIWVRNNASLGAMAHALSNDTNYLYVTGRYTQPPATRKWLIEKWDKNGNNVWVRTPDSCPGDQYLWDNTVDSTHIYTVGRDLCSQWRIEKWDKSGNLTWARSSASGGEINSITADATYLYIAGAGVFGPGDYQWRIEKWDKNGNRIWFRTTNYSPSTDKVYSIVNDATHIYVSGHDKSLGNDQWRIEKWDKDGNFVWSRTSNPSAWGDFIRGSTFDDIYLYVVGADITPGNSQWRIEKWEVAAPAGFPVCGAPPPPPYWLAKTDAGSEVMAIDGNGNMYLANQNINLNTSPPGGLTDSVIIKDSTSDKFSFNLDDIYITGDILENEASVADGDGDDLVIKNAAGTNMARFDATTGNIFLRGSSCTGAW